MVSFDSVQLNDPMYINVGVVIPTVTHLDHLSDHLQGWG